VELQFEHASKDAASGDDDATPGKREPVILDEERSTPTRDGRHARTLVLSRTTMKFDHGYMVL
jgi:hypothetical protein